MVGQNLLRIDYYERYQEIIEEYNRGCGTLTTNRGQRIAGGALAGKNSVGSRSLECNY